MVKLFLVLIGTGDAVQYPHRSHSYYQRRVSAAYKRQGKPRRRDSAADDERVYYDLNTVYERNAAGKQIAESILAVRRDF